MNSYKIIVILLFVFYTQHCNSQTDSLTFQKVDSLSFQYYNQQDLSKLKEITNQAIKQGIDFYYLRTRLAITAFNNKNYDLAYKHFKIANEKIPEDTVIQEYIYYSLKYNFLNSEAETFARTLNPSLRQKLLKDKETIVTATVNLGYLNSPSIDPKINKKGNENIYAEGKINGSMNFEELGLKFKLNHKNNLYFGLSKFNSNAIGFVQTTYYDSIKDISIQQYQANIFHSKYLKNGFTIGFGGAYYKIKSESFTSSYSNFTGYSFEKSSSYNSAFSILINANKRSTYKNIGIQYSLYNYSNLNQHQLSTSFHLFPLGNTKLILGCGIHDIYSNSNSIVYNFSASVLAHKSVLFSTQYWQGNMNNFISESGFATYNTSDPILKMLTFKADFYIKKLILSPSITFQERESSYIKYTSTNSYSIIKSNYNSQSINLSLTWKF